MNVHSTYTYPYGKRHLLRSGYWAIRCPHKEFNRKPFDIKQEITRPQLGKEVVLRRSADGADSMKNTVEGP